MCRGEWLVRSGAVPPTDEGLITRPDTVPGLDAVLVPGAVVALVPGQDAPGRARDWPRSSGKTQLACYLAGSLWRSRSVDVLAWVAATSRAAVLSGYVQAAAELGLDYGGDAESVAARFLAWLAGTGRPWLVVLDDLRDAADLDGLWPAGPAGRLLITTADRTTIPARPGVLALPVPAFSTREALTYLSGRLTTDPDQRNGAIDLAADLGCDPAALAQAAAVIISSGISCREFRGFFVQQQAAGGGRGDPPTAAWFTWTAAASHAERLAPGAGTWRLLALTALLDSHGIPLAVFTAPAVGRYLSGPAAAHQLDPQRAWSALQVLDRVGLVTADATAVWVGRALQAAVRSVAPPGLLDQAARAAADALAEVWPAGQPRSWPAAALRACAVSLRQAAGDVLWSGGCHRLLLTAGYSLADAGLTRPAVAWWRELAADSSRILGPDHPDTVAIGGLLAGALLAAGDAAEAVTWSQWVLASRASVLGPDHPGAIAAQVSLGRALVAGGKAGDAVRVLEEAAGHSERVRGPDDAGTLAVRDEYAAACVAAGLAAEAVGSCKRSLAVREHLHGPADPATLAASLRLAAAYLAAGKFTGAIGQYKRVLATREHALGPDHPDTLAARTGLAAYDAAGQMGAALQEHQQACAGYEDVFGAGHPDTLARRADLARAYSAAGQLGDAVTLLRDTIARSEQALSPGDPLTRTLRQALTDITGEMTTQ
jgi:tetratricopeptide (TPR) repeat protein